MQIGSALLVPLQQRGHALGASGTAEDEHRTEYLQRLHRLVQQHGREHGDGQRLKIPAHGDGLHRQFCAIWTGAMPRRYPPEARDLTIGRDLCIITTKSLVFCEICPPASGDREESNVTYTVDDTMKKLLSAPEAVAVLERFFPKILKNPALQMTAAMTLRQVAGFAQSGLTADSLAEIDAQLRALPSSDG